ncbi:Uncharacterised protein [Mycobacteroides abscessus subsp. abscessus]|nr:Uncharacterised protein [Mycobacteroides abscessus subsp. abscessus]
MRRRRLVRNICAAETLSPRASACATATVSHHDTSRAAAPSSWFRVT